MRLDAIQKSEVDKIPLILKLDAAGQPVKWVHWQEAVVAYWTDKVKWELGEEKIVLRGGSKSDGTPSTFEMSPIIAVEDQSLRRLRGEPPLTNRELFRRDGCICLYCGDHFKTKELTRDHIHPTSKGGKNKWSNVATACARCNKRKADKTLDESGMQLLAVPYVPNRFEWLLLQNRSVLADQQQFLEAGTSDRYKNRAFELA